MRGLKITISVPVADDVFEAAATTAKLGEHVKTLTDALKADDIPATIKHQVASVRARGPDRKPRKPRAPVLAEVA